MPPPLQSRRDLRKMSENPRELPNARDLQNLCACLAGCEEAGVSTYALDHTDLTQKRLLSTESTESVPAADRIFQR